MNLLIFYKLAVGPRQPCKDQWMGLMGRDLGLFCQFGFISIRPINIALLLHLSPHFPLPPQMAFPLTNPASRLPLKLPTSGVAAAFPSPNYDPRLKEFPPNALRRKIDRLWRGGFSLGVDLGLSRTGLALSKGFSVRPLTVLELRGQKLELRLLEIARDEEVDEFIIGLPRSCDGKETTQSNKVRSVAGRLAVRAAEKGWRVYLQDEHGTSTDATNRMINVGLNKTARERKIDAYAAVMVLERYFLSSGEATELVLPKDSDLQERLRKGPPRDIDFYSE